MPEGNNVFEAPATAEALPSALRSEEEESPPHRRTPLKLEDTDSTPDRPSNPPKIGGANEYYKNLSKESQRELFRGFPDLPRPWVADIFDAIDRVSVEGLLRESSPSGLLIPFSFLPNSENIKLNGIDIPCKEAEKIFELLQEKIQEGRKDIITAGLTDLGRFVIVQMEPGTEKGKLFVGSPGNPYNLKEYQILGKISEEAFRCRGRCPTSSVKFKITPGGEIALPLEGDPFFSGKLEGRLVQELDLENFLYRPKGISQKEIFKFFSENNINRKKEFLGHIQREKLVFLGKLNSEVLVLVLEKNKDNEKKDMVLYNIATGEVKNFEKDFEEPLSGDGAQKIGISGSAYFSDKGSARPSLNSLRIAGMSIIFPKPNDETGAPKNNTKGAKLIIEDGFLAFFSNSKK